MGAEDGIRLELPPELRWVALSELLDRVFPASDAVGPGGGDARGEVAAQFDLRANPDLPEIYAIFLEVCEEWRDWRCALLVTLGGGDGERGAGVELAAEVWRLLPGEPAGAGPPVLALHLEQQYCALEYAVRHGFWAGRGELLEWLRGLTLLYFLDKHEARLDSGDAAEWGPGLRGAVEGLSGEGLIVAAADGAHYSITREGRRFIGGLLAETESFIDQFDHYQDTAVYPDLEMAEFGVGRGVDLRVQAFLAEGVNPVRAVFLLRLYDGTLDARLADWWEAIEDEGFYEWVLEPVVNRYGVDAAVMEAVLESGYSWLEERQEEARARAAREEVLRRAGGMEGGGAALC